MSTEWDPDWFAGDVPTRDNLVKWEPYAYVGFDPGEPLREAKEPCPGCGEDWTKWCLWECEGPLDPWNPADNDGLRRYFD